MPAVSSESARPFPIKPLAGIALVVAIYFGSQIIGGILLSLTESLSGHKLISGADTSPEVQFAYIAVVEAITLSLLFLVMRNSQAGRQQIGLLRPRIQDIGATLLAYPIYFGLNLAVILSATSLFHIDTAQKQQTGFEGAQSPFQLALVFIALVILPPIVEEIVMRGFLFSSLKRGFSVVPAALITSLLFASAHLQFGNGVPLLWVAALDTFVLSLVLCYLRQRTGSLWAGIGLHMLKNGLAFLALFILPQTTRFL